MARAATEDDVTEMTTPAKITLTAWKDYLDKSSYRTDINEFLERRSYTEYLYDSNIYAYLHSWSGDHYWTLAIGGGFERLELKVCGLIYTIEYAKQKADEILVKHGYELLTTETMQKLELLR